MKNIVNDENYYIVHGWIKNRLGLKGTKRDVYAIIFGFSQDGECEFTGSVKYLEEWLDVSRYTIIKALKELTESGLIIKRVDIINGVQFNRYKTNSQVVKNLDGGSKNYTGVVKNLDGGSQKIRPNNDNILKEKEKEIILYLNSAISANFRYQSKATQAHINARLNEGYTVEDFKTVIDKKVAEWKGTEMAQYLRPETLFGTKFESYLNAPKPTAKTGTRFQNERQYTKADYDALITNIDDVDF